MAPDRFWPTCWRCRRSHDGKMTLFAGARCRGKRQVWQRRGRAGAQEIQTKHEGLPVHVTGEDSGMFPSPLAPRPEDIPLALTCLGDSWFSCRHSASAFSPHFCAAQLWRSNDLTRAPKSRRTRNTKKVSKSGLQIYPMGRIGAKVCF